MTRASDVRDELVTEFETRFPDIDVEPFLLPEYEREELGDKPHIGVRVGGREFEMLQGPDEIDVIIEVGVVGVLPAKQGDGGTSYRSEMVAKGDEYDAVAEQIIGLWLRNGELSRCGMAGHWPVAIEQAIPFDPNALYRNNIYLSVIKITYRDSEDD